MLQTYINFLLYNQLDQEKIAREFCNAVSEGSLITIQNWANGKICKRHPYKPCLLIKTRPRQSTPHSMVNKTLKTKIMEECVVGMEGREQKWSRDSKHSQDKNINWNKNNNKK